MGSIQILEYQVEESIVRKVHAKADADGVPRNVVMAFVLGESGGRPDAIGDNGHSVGLLQLHDEGQGRGMTVAERRDPDRNLDVGMRDVSRAWRANAQLSGRARVLRTAAESGHPGDPSAFAAGTYAHGVAVRGTNAIADVWERLEGAAPTIPVGSTVAGVPAESVNRAIDQLTTYVREHPLQAAAVGVGALLLLA